MTQNVKTAQANLLLSLLMITNVPIFFVKTKKIHVGVYAVPA